MSKSWIEYRSGLTLIETLRTPHYGRSFTTPTPEMDSLTSLTLIDVDYVPNHSLKVGGGLGGGSAASRGRVSLPKFEV